MSNLSDFIGSGGGLKPFQDLGTVTGTVDLDVGTYSSFRVVQGAGDITFTVSGTSADTAGNVELWFYPDSDWSVDLSAFELVDNGYVFVNRNMETLTYDSVSFSVGAQDATPTDIAFNSDGTKLYILGNTNDSVYQYSPTYDLGPYLLYAIQHLNNTTYLRTISPDYTIQEAP